MSKTTSIALSEHWQKFIKEKVDSGQFKSASAVVRHALEELEKYEQRMQGIREVYELGKHSTGNGEVLCANPFNEAGEPVLQDGTVVKECV